MDKPSAGGEPKAHVCLMDRIVMLDEATMADLRQFLDREHPKATLILRFVSMAKKEKVRYIKPKNI